ncbi:MAG TPA: M28 family peptidase [Candidatus Solibacter sp.]
MESRKEEVRAAAPGWSRLLLTGALALWTVVGLWPPSRPEPVPAGAPAGEFSAERAMVHVRAIAQRPHPLKSADHERVRTYIAGQFQELGAPAGLHTGQVTFRGETVALENLVARLPGTDNTRPVMLAAHYDSTPRGPGAGDDAHGVAVLLETLRALRAGPPLRNDVIFLVTDGEEAGLLGASAFVKEHPWRREPGVVLNFEARGTGGRATMFETSAGNEWLIRNLQAGAPWANATSFAYEVYRRMPNDTDLTVFKRAGLAGLNFAFIEHPEWYHRPQDDPEHLDRRSVQEQGDYALALARQFGGRDLRRPSGGDAVYFPTPLTDLIVYPEWYVLPLGLMTALALALSALAGWRRRKRGLWMALLLAIPALLLLFVARAAPGASYVLQWPLLGGVLAFSVCMTARERVGVDWRLAVLMLAPAGAFLLILPMLQTLVVALGPAAGGKIAAVAVLFVLITVMPQVALIAGKTN